MNLWRLLFGRRAAAAPPDRASLESAKPELEVSAPVVVVSPKAAVPEAVMSPEAAVPEAVMSPEAAVPEAVIATEVALPEPMAPGEGADLAPEDTDEPPAPEPEISPLRLDQALRRLREENPAPSDENPPAPSG
jgi:hypothetical protein